MGVKFVGLEPSPSFDNEIPECPHGPMLLFEKAADGGTKAGRQFYACAACRDRKQCAFFLWRDERLPAEKVWQWRERARRPPAPASHRCRYDRGQIVLSEGGQYCLDCNQLVAKSEASCHRTHQTRPATVSRPTELLRPRACNKSAAQFLFSAASVSTLDSLVTAVGVRRLLCLGSPRLHERRQREDEQSSLLLDFDERYEEFWPPEKLCVYNMFNHHMFSEHGQQVYREFVQRDGGEGLGVFVDPPFGGRLEALSLTLRKIAADAGAEPTVFLVLPYFNEPDVLANFPGLHMTDFRVEYDNHDKYTSAAGGRKFGSPVRLFSSLSPERVLLTEPQYRLCQPCRRWVHRDNRHCQLCGSCTSKDGRPYRHCDPCARCVKVTWQHCADCDRCALPDHPCAGGDSVRSAETDSGAAKRAGKPKKHNQRKRQRR